MSIEKIVGRLIESMELKSNKKIGEAATRAEAIEKFEKFLKVQPGKYKFKESDFVTMRTEPKNAWVYSPASTEDLPEELEKHLGFWVLKVTVNEDAILSIYESEVKGKTVKKPEAIKEEIEDKYSKWF